MCAKVTSFFDLWHHYNTHSDLRSKFFFKKKYVSTSPSPCAHFGERNLFLSHIRRSNRIKRQVRSFFVGQKGRKMAKSRHLAREAVFFAGFLPTSIRLLASGYFPGLCVSPAVMNALRLSSPSQFRSKNAADPTHAHTLRHRRRIWQKKTDFSL